MNALARLPIQAVAALALLPAAAPAATVEVRLVEDRTGGYLRQHFEAVYAAAPGERNRVAVSTLDELSHTVRFSDPGATIVPGERCRSLDDHTAECTVEEQPLAGGSADLATARVSTADQDDTIRAGTAERPGPTLIADGGPGDDVLDGPGELNGGGGRDRMTGGYLMTDGDTPGAVDADLFEGEAGGGVTVSYAGRTGNVTVDLADPGADGERGEGDRLRGVQHLIGGDGDDDLGGDGGLNRLSGGAGDDHLDGEGGEDLLDGGLGDDRLHGHRGDDTLEGLGLGSGGADQLRGDQGNDHIFGASAADRLRCGSGRDVVGGPRDALIPTDCERLTFHYDEPGDDEDGNAVSLEITPSSAVSTGTVRIGVDCPRPEARDGSCKTVEGRLRLTSLAGNVPIGEADFTRPEGRRGSAGPLALPRVPVRLNAFGRRSAGRKGGVLTTFRLDIGVPLRWRARLRGP